MSRCTPPLSNDPCGIDVREITIKEAGNMVGIDLSKPIDLSQTEVTEISVTPIEFYGGGKAFERITKLRKFININGQRELLEIEFTLKSFKLPRFETLKREKKL